MAGTFPKYSTDTEHYAVFFEDRFELNDQWSFIGGARYDSNEYERTNIDRASVLFRSQVDAKFTDTTWRVGVVFQPIETLSLYAQYATAVDPIGSLASLSVAQTQLDLTTGKQIEVGVKHATLDSRLEWTLAFYDIKKQDLLVDDPRSGNPDDQAQIGEQSSRGVEASLALTVNDQWRIDANAALLHAEYQEYGEFTGNTPFSVPEQLANLWVSYQFAADWRARAGLRYVGKRYLDESNTTELPSYSVVDAALDWAVSDALTLGAHVRNAADKTYAQAAYRPQFIFGMPRTWELQARYQFCNAHPREHQQRQERWLVATDADGCMHVLFHLPPECRAECAVTDDLTTGDWRDRRLLLRHCVVAPAEHATLNELTEAWVGVPQGLVDARLKAQYLVPILGADPNRWGQLKRESGDRAVTRCAFRGCPAAVIGNERRAMHWAHSAWEAAPSRSSELRLALPMSPKTCQGAHVS